jgi:excinuclease ABC subunit C
MTNDEQPWHRTLSFVFRPSSIPRGDTYVARFHFDAQCYPGEPGCYLFKDAAGRVLYVGKAKNLRRRLASYFRPRSRDWRARRLAARVRDIEVILVNNEVESLVLENNLIKGHKPPYNAKLVDDDTGYFHIALTGGEYPRLVPYRKNRLNKQLGGDSAVRLFGPYVSRDFRDVLLEHICETFGVRTCASMPDQVCLRYHLGRCCGVCEAKLSPAGYARIVERAVEYLSHPHDDLIERMRRHMRACAERLEFERAGRTRDRIRALESALERQIVERMVDHDQDVIYFGEHVALVTHVRRGVVQGMSTFELKGADAGANSRSRFLLERYASQSPGELIVNGLDDPQAMAEALTSANGTPIRVTVPRSGVAYELLKLCERNYNYRLGLANDERRTTNGG